MVRAVSSKVTCALLWFDVSSVEFISNSEIFLRSLSWNELNIFCIWFVAGVDVIFLVSDDFLFFV